jgi:uncharacterized membrane protein
MHMSRNMEGWEQAISILAGAALVAVAITRRKPFGGAATAGIGLVLRGASGYCPVNAAIGRHPHGRRRDDTRAALGGSRGIHLRESVTIARPPAEVFAAWRDPATLARLMPHVERIEATGDGRTHWVMRGPAGVTLEWDAETIAEVEPERIAWRTLPGAAVASAGSVQFRPFGEHGTEVHVTLQYDPPGGKAGAALVWLWGDSPQSQLREDLRRFKAVLEAGEAPTASGQPAGHRSAVFQAAREALT